MLSFFYKTTIYIKSLQNRLLKVCYVLATSPCLPRLFDVAINSTNEANQAGGMRHQAVYINLTTTLSITSFSITTLSMMTLSIMTLSIMTFSIMTYTGTIFTKLNFLRILLMGSLSYCVRLHKTGKTCFGQTHQLSEQICNL
jgi:hypothetical protein